MNPHQDDAPGGPTETLAALIKARATRYDAPADLRAQISASLVQAPSPLKGTQPAVVIPSDPNPAFQARHALQAPRRVEGSWWPQWLNVGAAFACGLLVSLAITRFMPQIDSQDRVAQEVVDGHVRSMMVAHLSDVVSTDQHTVKPWFAARLDFSPPVHDLAKDGFALAGGRLDYVAQRPVAALVYQRNQHTINVFVWPLQAGPAPAPQAQAHQGFNVVAWTDAGMQFWAVSDLTTSELQTFAQLMRKPQK